MTNSYLDQVEFADNPEPRCPCVLLLDLSSSMSGEPIRQLNEGLRLFEGALQADPLAAVRVEVALITFGSQATLVQDFVTASHFRAPTLLAAGSTPMGAAINLALDQLRQRKESYRRNGISYYRPWIFLITDGEPTDEWQSAARRVQQEEASRSVAFFAVGVQGANLQKLGQISTTRTPVLLKGLNFGEMFLWLSQSLTTVSHSQVGEQVPLPPPTGWSAV
jgi:uncharacterized protein YegL